jgi:hypothetical protein
MKRKAQSQIGGDYTVAKETPLQKIYVAGDYTVTINGRYSSDSILANFLRPFVGHITSKETYHFLFSHFVCDTEQVVYRTNTRIIQGTFPDDVHFWMVVPKDGDRQFVIDTLRKMQGTKYHEQTSHLSKLYTTSDNTSPFVGCRASPGTILLVRHQGKWKGPETLLEIISKDRVDSDYRHASRQLISVLDKSPLPEKNYRRLQDVIHTIFFGKLTPSLLSLSLPPPGRTLAECRRNCAIAELFKQFDTRLDSYYQKSYKMYVFILVKRLTLVDAARQIMDFYG